MTVVKSIGTHLFKVQQSIDASANGNLLAPRSVHFSNEVLAVSDTGKNRVLLWYADPKDNRQASITLGQPDAIEQDRNSGAAVSASSLLYPSGVWTNGKKLIVADAWNHRVLIWHSMPRHHAQPADVVVGQQNFVSNQPNLTGVSKQPNAQSLYWPYGIDSNGLQLWIADTGNRRVLFYDAIPTENFAPATQVIGQENFNERDFNMLNAIWPYSVKVKEDGHLAIADTQSCRILIWDDYLSAFHHQAKIIIGQPDFFGSGQNQFQLKPSANTLNWCYDLCFYKKGIAVADTANSRILIWDKIPNQNNNPADYLIGQPSFHTHGESSLSMTSTAPHEMYWPFALNSFEDKLLIVDTGNHRILIY